VSGTALASGDLTINGVNVGTSVSGSADDIVNSINSVVSQTAVTATATSTVTATNAPTGKVDLQAGDLVINGVDIGTFTGSYNYATQGTNLANQINAKTASTGVTATSNAVDGRITLSSSTGKTIAVTTSNATAGANRLEQASGLEVSASSGSTFGTETFTLAATKGNSVGTFAFAAAVNGNTFQVGSTIFEFQSAGTTGAVSGGHIIVGDTYTDDATLNAEVLQAINGASIGVQATTTGGTNVTITDNFAGVETLASHTLANGTGASVTAITNTAGTGISEGATFTVDGATYTFIKGASTGNSVSLSAAAGTAAATILASAATTLAARISANHTAPGGGANTSNHTATAALAVVTATSVLRGTAGNALATGITGVTVAAGVAATDGAYASNTTFGTISLNSNAAYQVGGNNPSKAGLSTAASNLTSISVIDISSTSGANQAISLVDGALDQVQRIRAALGAIQNRFESTVANLSATSENLSAARSRIRDADFAQETAALTRGQILQQAGTAILAQANALPQNVLSLLR
jgi:flagellin